ncbi:UNVERIFIED_CONTAM: Calpain-6 [Siphonaria sp. JEL0065]|nr:Calpain-6 [Siphonaria sp. JEL0065]
MTIHPTLLEKVVPEIPEQDWINDWDARKRGNYYRGYHRSPDLHPGIFRFRFFQFGKWVEVVVDDLLPCTPQGELIYARSKNRSEFGISLLEKAYAKLFHGSYAAISTGLPTGAFVDLSGNVPEQIDLLSTDAMAEFKSPPSITTSTSSFSANLTRPVNQYEPLFDFLAKELRQGSLVSCSMKNTEDERQMNEDGLLYGHSYAITGVVHVKIRMSNMRRRPVSLVKLRNPWGSLSSQNGGGYTGAWAVWSEEWQLVTKQELRRLNLHADNNGAFFMSFEDFLKYFTSVIICRQVDKFNGGNAWQFYSAWSIREKTAGGSIQQPESFPQNPQYVLDINAPSQIMISMIQSDIPISSEFNISLSSTASASSKSLSRLSTIFSQPSTESLTSHTTASESLHRPSISSASRTQLGVLPLRQQPRQPLNNIGFTILRVEENRKYRVHKLIYDVAAIVPYVDSREIFTRLKLDVGRYVLFPTTLNVGEEGRFLVRVHTDTSNNAISVFPLIKDFPTPPKSMVALQTVLKSTGVNGNNSIRDKIGWVHPIGVFRVEVVQCDDLKRCMMFGEGANPYCVLKFMDLGEGMHAKDSLAIQQPPTPPKEPEKLKPPPQTQSSIEWMYNVLSSPPAIFSTPPPAAPPAPLPPQPPPSKSKTPAPPPTSTSFSLKIPRHSHTLVTTHTVKNTLAPIFKSSFMWAVRRPREASLLVEVWSRRTGVGSIRGVGLVGDVLMGFVVLDVEDYVGEGRRDKAWEVCMALLKPDGLSGQGIVGDLVKGKQQESSGKGEAPAADVGKIILRVKFESSLENL